MWDGRGGAGEIGHVVVKSDGRTCPCGRTGCMEAYAGRGAMEARAREKADEGEKTVLFEIMEERGKPRLSSGIWARALERDDKLAHHLVEPRGATRSASAVASSLNLLDVEAVVIGGGLGIRLGEPYVEKIREAIMPHLFADHRPPEVLLASLGDLGGAVGATLLAAEKAPAHACLARVAAAISASSRRPELAPRDRRVPLRREVVARAGRADRHQPAVGAPAPT